MNKIWKITHTGKVNSTVKFTISLSSNGSKGIILNPGEFVLARAQMTAALDSQVKRGFVTMEEFDNSALQLTLGINYNVSVFNNSVPPVETTVEPVSAPVVDVVSEPSLSEDDKLHQAAKDASDYIANNPN